MDVDLLQRMPLHEAARRLDLHPFDLTRILVVENLVSPDLKVHQRELDLIRQKASLEWWWPETTPLQDGPALCRAVLQRMLLEDRVAPRSTRADNLTRGLAPDQQALLRAEINKRIDDGWLVTTMGVTGLMISLSPDRLDTVRASVGGKGTTAPQGLGRLR